MRRGYVRISAFARRPLLPPGVGTPTPTTRLNPAHSLRDVPWRPLRFGRPLLRDVNARLLTL